MSEPIIRDKLFTGEIVDFEVISENWNVYELQDSAPVTMKAKLVVTKIINTGIYKSSGEPIYAVGSQRIFTTFAPPELRDKPTFPPPSEQDRYSSIIQEVDFKTIEENWNEYKLNDGSICKQKLILTGVQKTSFFTMDGDPLYNVESDVIGRFIIPTNLWKKNP